MQTPEGFREQYSDGEVLKLNRALYGLKQAGHQWHKKLNQVLTSIGFTLVRCDNSIWVFMSKLQTCEKAPTEPATTLKSQRPCVSAKGFIRELKSEPKEPEALCECKR